LTQIVQWQCMKGTGESDSSVKRTARRWQEPLSHISPLVDRLLRVFG